MVSDLSIYLTIADFLFLQYCPQKKSPRKFGMTHVFVSKLSDLSTWTKLVLKLEAVSEVHFKLLAYPS